MKERLDLYLVQQGYFTSREKAKRAIMAGYIYVNGQISDKAGNLVKDDDIILVKGASCPYVSRGGLKLEKAIKSFSLNFNEKVALDIGASTGGFTDCMLQKGAGKIFAIDVGYGQLDWKLRNDNRVINMEKCNFRYLKPEDIGELADIAVCDVSFISLKIILPVAYSLLKPHGEMVCLIKPQFEAGREQVGKNGIVRDKKVRLEVIKNTVNSAADCGFTPVALDFSPITGAKGNIEYLLYMEKKDEIGYTIDDAVIEKVVNNSCIELE